LPFTVAEALYFGRLDATSYSAGNRASPALLELAQRVEYAIDPDAPRDEQYKGWIEVELDDGTVLEAVHLHGREDHMSDEAMFDKIEACLDGTPAQGRAAALRDAVMALEGGGNVSRLMAVSAGE
jgi:2-methylcitrate dehydratase PrpD